MSEIDERLTEIRARLQDNTILLDQIVDLRKRLATITALVPEAEWLEEVCQIIRCNCPACKNGIAGAEQHPNGVDWLAVECEYCGRIIAAIRAWRGDGDGDGHEEGEG